jgi:hypothetical protein
MLESRDRGNDAGRKEQAVFPSPETRSALAPKKKTRPVGNTWQ